MSAGIIRVNNIDYRGSICDGPGIRTVVFLQGCNVHCKGCHNPQTWNIHKGYLISIEELVQEICMRSDTKRITISGGEPMIQSEAVSELAVGLYNKNFDIALYTSYQFDEIPRSILKYLNYIKCGKYLEKYCTTTIPYIGSTNQKFITLNGGDIIL